MGQFEFAEFDSITFVKTWFVHIIIIAMIAITNITLLNFVIAILSNTYEQLTNLSNSVYLKYIIS